MASLDACVWAQVEESKPVSVVHVLHALERICPQVTVVLHLQAVVGEQGHQLGGRQGPEARGVALQRLLKVRERKRPGRGLQLAEAARRRRGHELEAVVWRGAQHQCRQGHVARQVHLRGVRRKWAPRASINARARCQVSPLRCKLLTCTRLLVASWRTSSCACRGAWAEAPGRSSCSAMKARMLRPSSVCSCTVVE